MKRLFWITILIFLVAFFLGGKTFAQKIVLSEDGHALIELPGITEISDKDYVLIQRAVNAVLSRNDANSKLFQEEDSYKTLKKMGMFLPEEESVLGLLSEYRTRESVKSPERLLFTRDALVDMEILKGRGDPFYNLLGRISRTETTFGRAVFSRMLLEAPLRREESLGRQGIVKAIVDNTALFDELSEVVMEFKEVEPTFLSFWNSMRSYNALKESYYFDQMGLSRVFNILPKKIRDKLTEWVNGLAKIGSEQSSPLEVNSFAVLMQPIAAGVALTVGTSLLYWFGYRHAKDVWKKSGTIKQNADETRSFTRIFSSELLSSWGEKWKDCWTGNTGCKECNKNNQWGNIDRTVALCEFGGKHLSVAFGFWTVLHSFSFYQKRFVDLLKTYETAQHQLVMVRKFIYETLLKVKGIAFAYPVLGENIESIGVIDRLLNDSKNDMSELSDLMETLKTDSFEEKSSFLKSFRGSVLRAYRLLDKVKNSFVGAFELMGEIDAYLSLAKLYRSSTERAPFCFAKFRNSAVPSVRLEGYWNPFLDPNKAVTNSISLGTLHKPGSVILTGPNAGGKSTSMKSVALAILMAQAFGIACADKMELTSFAYLDTHLAKTDDISKKQSSYMCEAMHMKDIIENLKALPEGSAGCVFMDELFNTTNPDEASAIGRSIGQYLARRKNVMCIISSHYKNMTNLESETAGVFENYHVTVDKSPDGSISYPFQIEKGLTEKTVALDILQMIGMEPEIVGEARRLVSSSVGNGRRVRK